MTTLRTTSSETRAIGKSLEDRWRALDARIQTWWDEDIRRATEKEIRDPRHNEVWIGDGEDRSKIQDRDHTLLFLPHPYISSAGSEAAFPEMYCWDIYFINAGLLAHGRLDIYRNHLLNHLFQIERFGFVLNGNRTYYRTRSQTPLLAADVWRYFEATGDREILMLAYPRLRQEFEHYWCADHHATPLGLATNRDLGDPNLPPNLAAEAEALDFTPIYGGDIRRCVPLQTNFALVEYARCTARIAGALGLADEEREWQAEADRRAALIRKYCWDEESGFYFEYDFVDGKRLPSWSVCAYWALWSGSATKEEAERLAGHLPKFLFDYGLSVTDRAYDSPHPQFQWTQWNYPSGWPPLQMMVADGLERYGYGDEAREIARRFLTVILDEYDRTSRLWEKYNVVRGNLAFPKERYAVPAFRGWTSAVTVVAGRKLFHPS